MEQKLLCSYFLDCGRMGELEGLFIAYQSDIDALVGTEVNFGEVLGKHSDITATIEEGDIKVVSSDREKIDWLQGIFLGDSITGFNPFDYVYDEE